MDGVRRGDIDGDGGGGAEERDGFEDVDGRSGRAGGRLVGFR